MPKLLFDEVLPARFVGCQAFKTKGPGFKVEDENDETIERVSFSDCSAIECEQDGFILDELTEAITMTNCVAVRNGTTTDSTTHNSFTIAGSGHVLEGCYASAQGGTTPKLLQNYALELGASSIVLRECTAGVAGAGATSPENGQFLDESTGSASFPVPGESALLYPRGFVGQDIVDEQCDAITSTSFVAIEVGGVDRMVVTIDIPTPGPRRLKISWDMAIRANKDDVVAEILLKRIVQDGATDELQQWNIAIIDDGYYEHASGFFVDEFTGPVPPTGKDLTYQLFMKRGYAANPTSPAASVRLFADVDAQNGPWRAALMVVEDLGAA